MVRVNRELSGIYFDQSLETHSPLFRDRSKRPDFLVPIPGIGSILVDVKERGLQEPWGTVIMHEPETQKYIQLQKDFKLSVWFAFTLKGSGFASWHWISLDEILEQVEPKDSSKSGQPFRGIPMTLCRTLGWSDGLSKLITEGLSQ